MTYTPVEQGTVMNTFGLSVSFVFASVLRWKSCTWLQPKRFQNFWPVEEIGLRYHRCTDEVVRRTSTKLSTCDWAWISLSLTHSMTMSMQSWYDGQYPLKMKPFNFVWKSNRRFPSTISHFSNDKCDINCKDCIVPPLFNQKNYTVSPRHQRK